MWCWAENCWTLCVWKHTHTQPPTHTHTHSTHMREQIYIQTRTHVCLCLCICKEREKRGGGIHSLKPFHLFPCRKLTVCKPDKTWKSNQVCIITITISIFIFTSLLSMQIYNNCNHQSVFSFRIYPLLHTRTWKHHFDFHNIRESLILLFYLTLTLFKIGFVAYIVNPPFTPRAAYIIVIGNYGPAKGTSLRLCKFLRSIKKDTDRLAWGIKQTRNSENKEELATQAGLWSVPICCLILKIR